MTQLTDLPLDDFISTFYGYGNYQAKYWFIGIEEGGGNSLEEIESRIRLWDERGRHELEDLKAYHLALGIDRFFTQPTTSQSTWRQLIRIMLHAPNKPASLDDIKQYQRDRLGQWGDTTCLIELMPLPAPSANHWPYSAFNIPSLQSREIYRQRYAPGRIHHIRQKISEYRPTAVVFYSLGLRNLWIEIVEQDFTQNGRFWTAIDTHTRYVIAPHPTSRGVGSDVYHTIGQWLRDA